MGKDIWPRKEERESYGQNHFYQYYTGLKKETILKLYNLYKQDFELFGYNIPPGLI